MAETHHEKLLAVDVLFALTATKPDSVDDLRQMIDVVTNRLQSMQFKDGDRFSENDYVEPSLRYRERQRIVLKKWLLCLQDHLMTENKIMNRYPTLKNKG